MTQAPRLKLNIGCGFNKKPGWINVDQFSACAPDQIVDVEEVPWPWPDNSADEILLSHVLEHVGTSPKNYLDIIKEIWRVCCDGARVEIRLPHPRHDYFLIDPTHVRAIHPRSFEHFSQRRNREWQAVGSPATPLGLYLGIDFDMEGIQQVLAPKWAERVRNGDLSQTEIRDRMEDMNNVVMEFTVILKAIKPNGP